jgi:hypothetical protein
MKWITLGVLAIAGIVWWLVAQLSPVTSKHYERWLNRSAAAYFAVGGTTPERPDPKEFIKVLGGQKQMDGYSVPKVFSYPTPDPSFDPTIYVVTYDPKSRLFQVKSKTE